MKKSVSILLAMILAVAMAVPVFAAQTEGGGITPFYTAINSIKSYISMNGNTAICVANVSQSGAKANIKLVLQRSSNGGSSYSDYATLSNQNYYTKNIAVEKSKSGLNTSYKYRTKVVVTIYDTSGNQIDSDIAYS